MIERLHRFHVHAHRTSLWSSPVGPWTMNKRLHRFHVHAHGTCRTMNDDWMTLCISCPCPQDIIMIIISGPWMMIERVHGFHVHAHGKSSLSAAAEPFEQCLQDFADVTSMSMGYHHHDGWQLADDATIEDLASKSGLGVPCCQHLLVVANAPIIASKQQVHDTNHVNAFGCSH